MRVELVHNRYLLCGCILDPALVKSGQVWAAADGSNRTVTILHIKSDWVTYSWVVGDAQKQHQKSLFAFQCRYCLVLPTYEIPEELK